MADRESVTHRGSGDESGGEAARPPEGNPGRMADPLPPPSIGGESIDWAERGLDSALPIGSAEPSGIGTLEEEAPVFGAGSVSGGRGRGRIGDRVFSALASGSGLFIVVLILLVAIFLVARAIPAIADDQSNFLFSRDWSVEGATLRFGVLDLLWVTVVISLLAMLIAVPIAIGIALFITQYAPKRLARPVAYVVDLLAAIPSIIYGIWGITVLAPKLAPVQRALYHIPGALFQNKNVEQGTIFNGGLVLAIMILPIITAISRDVFDRTPRQNVEAAWALGSTRWEMIRLAVLPYGRPGVIAGSMLGLGRALGETIAITLILSKSGVGSPFTFSIFNGGETFASKIANNAGEFDSPQKTGAFIAAGLVLFVLTFIVNAIARIVIERRKAFTE